MPNRLSITRSLLALPLTAILGGGLSGCALDIADDDEITTLEGELVLDGENWVQLVHFLESADEQENIAGLYGFAIVEMHDGCTGFLISDDVVVTNRHCRRDDTSGDLEIRFGHVGGDWTEQKDLGLEEAARRLRMWGLTPIQAEHVAPNVMTFMCEFDDSDYAKNGTYQDIDYYRCKPNTIHAPWPPSYAQKDVQILPGTIWGHLNVRTTLAEEDDPLYLLTHNVPLDPVPGALRQIMVSPGGSIIDESTDPPDSDITHDSTTFAFDGADATNGSSGSPVIGTDDHRVFGVFFGDLYLWEDDIDENQNTGPFSIYRNYGSHWGGTVFQYIQPNPVGDVLPGSGTVLANGVMGGNGGTAHEAYCPAGYAVAGISGLNYNGVIGDVGIVCLPYRGPHYTTTPEPQLDEAVIISGGSVTTTMPTGFYLPQEDFNTRFHERIEERGVHKLDHNRQSVNFCPPGSFVSGIRGQSDNLVRNIEEMQCKEVHRFLNMWTGQWIYYQVASYIGIEFPIGGSSSAPATSSECGPNSIAVGMYTRSAWFTDRVRLICRTFE